MVGEAWCVRRIFRKNQAVIVKNPAGEVEVARWGYGCVIAAGTEHSDGLAVVFQGFDVGAGVIAQGETTNNGDVGVDEGRDDVADNFAAIAGLFAGTNDGNGWGVGVEEFGVAAGVEQPGRIRQGFELGGVDGVFLIYRVYVVLFEAVEGDLGLDGGAEALVMRECFRRGA